MEYGQLVHFFSDIPNDEAEAAARHMFPHATGVTIARHEAHDWIAVTALVEWDEPEREAPPGLVREGFVQRNTRICWESPSRSHPENYIEVFRRA